MNANDQIKDFISKHSLKGKIYNQIDGWIELLKSNLNKLSEIGPIDLVDYESILDDVSFPLNDQQCRLKASFLFIPPNIHVIGSYSLKCISRSDEACFDIDLALEIPKSCWQRNDHLNYIYHRKRALYLAYIAKHLQLFDFIKSVEFKYLDSNFWKPILVVTPIGKLGRYCNFIISAFPAEDKSFVYQKFHFSKLNIREETLNYNQVSSPFYNSAILHDLSMVYFSQTLSTYINENLNVRDALALIRIWLENRKIRKKFSHIITTFTCNLLKQNLLNPNHSCFQIFKSILHYISLSLWNSEETFCNLNDEDQTTSNVLDYFPVCLIETKTNLNLCFDVTFDSYERLKFEAQSTLNHLNGGKLSILHIITSQVLFHNSFDYIINISTDTLKLNNFNKGQFVDFGFDLVKTSVPQIVDIIKKAVCDRILLIHHNYSEDKVWSLNENPPQSSLKFITFGIIINKSLAFNGIMKGPLANQPEAQEFRAFWGEKSEIRRFQNGDIREAIYWECNSIQEKRNIILNAIKYALNRKLHLKLNSIASTFGFLDFLVELKNIKFDDTNLFYSTGEYFLQLITQNMNSLKKKLYDLNELSFSIVDIVSVDSAFRSTEVFPDLPINSNCKQTKSYCNIFDLDDVDAKITYVKAYKLIIKIDLNSKLIDSIETIKKQRYLLYYELGRKISKTYNLFFKLNDSHLDVFFNGYVFRLILSFNKEIAIYRQMSSRTKLAKIVESFEADEIEFETQVLPSISSCINTFGQTNASFALACRLFKRWLSLQMIKHFFNEITLDLLAVYAYEHFSLSQSNSHIAGFFNIIKFIAEFDFVTNPMILNFNDNLSSERVDAIKENFMSNRTKHPVMFIVTPYDRKLSYHTRSTPIHLIVHHMKKLAKALYDNLSESIQLFKAPDIKKIFRCNVDMFDMIIKLNTKKVPNKYQSIDFPNTISIKKALYCEDSNNSMPITDYNPALIYLNSLKKAYSNLALFFYDDFGGIEIGVLLKPDCFKMKPFNFSNIEASMLSGTSTSLTTDNVILNLEALIEDFEILGDDLVDKVIIQSDKLYKKSL